MPREKPLEACPSDLRPVTPSDPAWFATVPEHRADGSQNPEYGQVYFQHAADGGLAYSFDPQGRRFCRRLGPPAPRTGWIGCQGRGFRIAGPVAEGS